MRTIATALTALLFASTSQTFAASVSQLKGSKALIQLEGDSANAGDEFYVLDSNGKRKAIIKISQIKGDKAIAEIIKGDAMLGGILKPRTNSNSENQEPAQRPAAKSDKKKKTDSQSEEESSSGGATSFLKRKKIVGGVLGGYAMNSMKLTVQNPNAPSIKEDVTLTDSSFSVKGFADYDFSSTFTVRAASGLETFAVKGTTSAAICDNGNSTSCTVSFVYLPFEASAHYNFMTGKTRAWAGIGYSFLFQLSKTVSVPNLSAEGTTNQEILISGGVDYPLSKGKFIPVVLEYGMFPGSSNVVASAIYLRTGYGFNF